ncbi:hypothetical protein [Achromobacter sp. DH1f]|uniref:hypothetical protein n=1 Tax=Achromobacter sp. DH1f TaxID=1397275 RepID=UPI000468CCD3|nr:hypothetical protein [Achromobacter sp. DH1f]
MNVKYKEAASYNPAVADACEIALVRLMLAFSSHKHLLRLVGGLVPRYLTPTNLPKVPAHIGTTDVDVVLNVEVLLKDGENYSSLREQLRAAGFSRLMRNGHPSSWQWVCHVGAYDIVVEFLQHTDGEDAGRLASLAHEDVSACRIQHIGIVEDWFEAKDVTLTLEDGIRTETIRYADVVSFVVLKALAFDSRAERKDAADLDHVLRYAGELEATADQFAARMREGKHQTAVQDALAALVKNFCTDQAGEGHRKSGPGASAAFRGFDRKENEDAFARECRDVSGRVTELLRLLESRVLQSILPKES